jgi:hypothetical protein
MTSGISHRRATCSSRVVEQQSVRVRCEGACQGNPLLLAPGQLGWETAATMLTFALGLLAAFGMSRYKGKGKDLIDGILTLPLVLPPTVIGFFLLLSFGKNSPIGLILERVGMTNPWSRPAIQQAGSSSHLWQRETISSARNGASRSAGMA